MESVFRNEIYFRESSKTHQALRLSGSGLIVTNQFQEQLLCFSVMSLRLWWPESGRRGRGYSLTQLNKIGGNIHFAKLMVDVSKCPKFLFPQNSFKINIMCIEINKNKAYISLTKNYLFWDMAQKILNVFDKDYSALTPDLYRFIQFCGSLASEWGPSRLTPSLFDWNFSKESEIVLKQGMKMKSFEIQTQRYMATWLKVMGCW